MSYSIRPLERGDFKSLISTYFAYYDELNENPDLGLTFYHEKPSIKDERGWFDSLYEGIRKRNIIARVLAADSKVVGLCDVNSMRPASEMDHIGILGIAINKEHRNQGHGTQLLTQTVNACRGRFEIIRLTVFTANDLAIHIYKRAGFNKIGTLKKQNKRGDKYYDVDVMEFSF